MMVQSRADSARPLAGCPIARRTQACRSASDCKPGIALLTSLAMRRVAFSIAHRMAEIVIAGLLGVCAGYGVRHFMSYRRRRRRTKLPVQRARETMPGQTRPWDGIVLLFAATLLWMLWLD